MQREIVAEPRIAASVTTSLAYLRGKHSILVTYPTIEDFSYALIDTTDGELKGCEHHFISLRNHLSQVLWRNQIFIGHSILEDLVYQVILLNVADPVRHLFHFLKHQGFQDNGVVIYPIHSLGILGFGFLQVISKVRASVFFPEFGMAITPQTNDYHETFHFLQDAFASFGIKRQIPKDLIHHYIRSRGAEWLKRNPLLILKVRSWPGNYYENQFLLKRKLQFATTFVFMLSTMRQPRRTKTVGSDTSTASINNFQTLDFKHYIVLHPKYRSRIKMNGQCVPMNLSRPELAEISDLNVIIDPKNVSKRSGFAKALFSLIRQMEDGYFQNCLRPTKNRAAERKIYQKLFQCLRYFRKSFRQTGNNFDEIVNITVAFEILLMDSHPRGRLVEELTTRLKLAFRGVRGSRNMVAAFDNLYKARCEIVHGGGTALSVDLDFARRMFVLAFMNTMKRLQPIPVALHEPMREILNREV